MEDKKFSKVNGRRIESGKKEDKREEEKSPEKICFQDSSTSSKRKLSVHKNISKQGKPFISFGHDNWNLVLHMIFGVSKSVRNAIYEEEFHIVDDDFSRKYKYELI